MQRKLGIRIKPKTKTKQRPHFTHVTRSPIQNINVFKKKLTKGRLADKLGYLFYESLNYHLFRDT